MLNSSKNRRKIKIFKIKFIIFSRYSKAKIYSTILETFMILFGVKDVMAMLNKKYLIVIQSKYIAEKYKEK